MKEYGSRDYNCSSPFIACETEVLSHHNIKPLMLRVEKE
jgi:hypothetical protein